MLMGKAELMQGYVCLLSKPQFVQIEITKQGIFHDFITIYSQFSIPKNISRIFYTHFPFFSSFYFAPIFF